jgi:hypothetical protein
VSTDWGILSDVNVLRPVLELMASISVFGSTPALTASTTASEVAAMAAAEIMLLANLVICAKPGASPT